MLHLCTVISCGGQGLFVNAMEPDSKGDVTAASLTIKIKVMIIQMDRKKLLC